MKDFVAHVRELLFLLGENRKRLPWLLGLFLVSSFLDVIGLGIIGPYLALAMNPARAMEGRLGAVLRALGIAWPAAKLLAVLGVGLVVVYLLKAAASVFINWKILEFSVRCRTDLQGRLMQGYQRQPYADYLQRNSSEYVKTIHEATSYVVDGVQTLLKTLSDGLVCLFILAFLAVTNGLTLFILVALLGSTVFVYNKAFHGRAKRYGRAATEGVQRVVQGIHEGTTGFKEVRILGKEAHFHRAVTSGAEAVSNNWAKATLITMTPRYLLEFILVAFVVLFVLVSLASGGDVSAVLPTLAVFAVAALRILPSANLLTTAITKVGYGRYSISLLNADLNRVQRYDALPAFQRPAGGGEAFHTLTLENVSFRYDGAVQWALRGLTLPIRQGESIGIIGPSGSGKTTLIDVLLGLLEPQEGRLVFNGRDLSGALAEWRAQVAYLPQEIFLVDGTLRDNIALGVDRAEVDDAKVREAVKQAQLSELVAELPKGLGTMLGERGVRLSGGQRQRVALARAFYFERSVLVLDEATSALDNETEREIVEEISRLKGGKTMIVIAHRLTTVQHCDRIYRLEKGSVAASGSYEAVVKA